MILQCAASPEMQLIISNTTEIGIRLLKEDINLSPPVSFPAKLLAILYHRYQLYKETKGGGMVIIPTELLPANAAILKGIILELSDFNQLENGFLTWLNEENHFCNSLVDRIVPGRPPLNPRTAILFDSVPPLVKMTSSGSAPRMAAMDSRDASSTCLARRPAACRLPGLPKLSRQCRCSTSITSGCGLVVALLSR